MVCVGERSDVPRGRALFLLSVRRVGHLLSSVRVRSVVGTQGRFIQLGG